MLYKLILIMGFIVVCSCDEYSVSEDLSSYSVTENDLDSYIYNGEVVSIIVGEEITIYGDEVASVPITNDLSVDYICKVGSQSGNNYVINATEEAEVYLYISATNDGANVRKTKSLLSIKEKINTGNKTITLIGNSLILGGGDDELVKVRSIFDSMTWTGIGLIGSAPDLREGYSGKTYNWLVNDADSPFTKAGVVNIPAYYTDNGLSVPDFIYMRMGVNGAAGSYLTSGFTSAEQVIWMGYIEELIDAFLAHDANVKIIISIPSNSENTGAGWYADYGDTRDQDEYIRIIHVMRSLIIANYTDYNARVTVAYSPWGLDRDDGYPKTDGVHTGGVHPDDSGYAELGQGLAFALNNLL